MFQPMPMETERSLLVLAQAGDATAAEKLVLHNAPLVVSIAKRYVGKGADFDDLKAEGNLGLVVAVHGFDLSREVRFVTFATYCVRRRMTDLLDVSHPVHVPKYLRKELYEASLYGTPVSEYGRRAEQVMDGVRVSELLDEIPDTDSDVYSEWYASSRVLEAELTVLERKVLELRYGLNDGQEHTLQQVADVIGFSRQYVQQISRTAIEKLRRVSDKL